MSHGATDPAAWTGLDPYIRPDLARSGLVTIDVQVDFLAGGASPLPGADRVVPAIAGLACAFRSAGRPIVHVVRLYQGSDVDLVRRSTIESGAQVVSPGTSGSQLAPALRVPGAVDLDPARLLAGQAQELAPGEVAIFKPRWSAFYRTLLHEHLAGLGVDTLVVAGLNYPNCPRATIADASARDYRVVMARDALSSIVDLHVAEATGIGVVPADSTTIIDVLTGASASREASDG